MLIAGKSFFNVPVKNKEGAYEKFMSISKNNYYTTGSLLDYEYLSKHYKLIAIDLKQANWIRKPWFKVTNYFYFQAEKW